MIFEIRASVMQTIILQSMYRTESEYIHHILLNSKDVVLRCYYTHATLTFDIVMLVVTELFSRVDFAPLILLSALGFLRY